MTDPAPIPLDEFTAALERLDRTELASFVGELETATADDVDVDPPFVTVESGGTRTELRVVPADVTIDAADVTVDAADVDAIVTAGGTPTPDVDADVRTPADLRRRLLYAMSPESGDAVCDSFLGVPARSPEYDGPAGVSGRGGSDARDGTDTDGRTERNDASGDDADVTGGGIATHTVAGGGNATEGSTPADSTSGAGGRPRDGSDAGTADATDPGSGPDRVGRRVVVGAVLALLVLAVGAGATQLAGGPVGGPAGSLLGSDDPAGSPPDVELEDSGVEGDPATNSAASTTRENSIESGEGGGDDASAGNDTTDGIGLEPGGRNVGLAPTCTRSYLHVVQIQMNALKYNDAATNEGIRTVRRFAAPRNRRSVGTTGSFVRLFETSTFAPMLSYDSAQYTPARLDDRSARVDVVIRENGSVTGRYEFRLRKLNVSELADASSSSAIGPYDVNVADPANASSGSAAGPHDGCWATNSVRAVESFD